MFDAYKIGVRLSLINDVSRGLSLIGTDFLRLNKNVDGTKAKLNDFHSSLGKITRMGMVGAGLGAVGFGGIDLLAKTFKPAQEYAHQLSQLGILGMTQADQAAVIARSWKTSSEVITSSVSDNIAAFREMRGLFGVNGTQEALGILPMAQRASAVLGSLTGNMQKVADVGYDMVKASELTTTGAITDSLLAKRSEQFLKASIAFGGKIDMHDMHMALKATKGSSIRYNDDFISNILPTLAMEMKAGKGGAQSAGTLLRNFDRAAVGQVIPKDKYQDWVDAGLLDTHKMTANVHQSGWTKLLAGAVVGQDLAVQNSYDWWNKYGEPGMQKLMAKNHLTEDQALSRLATNQQTGDLFKKYHFQHMQFERDRLTIAKALDSKTSYDALLKTDPMLAQQALHKKWEELLGVIGFQVMPQLIDGTMWLSRNLRDLSGWIEKNKGLAKGLVLGFGALSGVLAFGGALTVATAGFKGLGLALSLFGRSGLVALPSSLLGVGRGLEAISSVGGVATLGTALGTIAGGLTLIGAACAGMAWLLSKLDPDTDLLNHPGMRRHHNRGRPDTWEKDDTLPQDHAGMHFQRFGRGGAWMPDGQTPLADHTGMHFVRHGRGGDWEKDSPASAAWNADITRRKQLSSGQESLKQDDSFVKSLAASIGDIIAAKLNGVSVKMDSTTVGNIVIDQMGRASMSPSTGTSGFDSRLGPLRPDYSY